MSVFDCVDHNKLWKILKEIEIPDQLSQYQTNSHISQETTLPVSWEICMQVKKQQLELDMEQQTGWKSGKEYIKAGWGVKRPQWQWVTVTEVLKSTLCHAFLI